MMDFATPTPLDAPIILLVGPDTDSRAACHYDLNHFGFRVQAAENAQRALRLIALAPPGVVVTELSLPNGDGVTLCRTLQGDAFTSSLPIVGITGHADDETARVARDAGCTAVLVKPCLPERVREEVVRVLVACRESRAHGLSVRERAQSLHDKSAALRSKSDAIHDRTARLLQLLTLRAEPTTADRLLSIALVRVRGEFQENPDLEGSVEELARLVDADAGSVRMVLETLVRAGFLLRTAEALYVVTRQRRA